MSETIEQRRQRRFPGQAHVAEGPHDLSNMYAMHHAFRRDLDRFVTAVQRTPVADRATWQALRDWWQSYGSVLHHHHSVEDVDLWPALKEAVRHAGQEHLLPTLAAMEAEHADIDPSLEACSTGFERLATSADEDARRALEVRIVATRAALLRHLEHEETEALPMTQRHLSAEGWGQLERNAGKAYRPAELLFLVPWVCDDVDATTRDELLHEAGLPMRVMLRLGRRKYLRRRRQAFGI